MKYCSSEQAATVLLLIAAIAMEMGVVSAQNTLTCTSRSSPCFRRVITCPSQCPVAKPSDPKAKGCFLNCNSPKCETICRGRKPSCNGVGSGCYDPRFIAADGSVFYFHGRRDEHFNLISDHNLNINARFVGLRPAGRTRDFTWIHALGVMSATSHTFAMEATRGGQWDDSKDHLRFSYNGAAFEIPQGHLSKWKSLDRKLIVERIGNRNSVVIMLENIAEISVNVVPITKEDDEIHNYRIPSDDCFAHLEVQFRFFGLSPEVEGVLGRTYRPDYETTAKQGVAMPVVGGENKYRTSSLLSADCQLCLFSPVSYQ